MNENWSKWEETSPDWFTADAIAKIPADLLPVPVLRAMGGVEGRRESIDAIKKEEAKERGESRRYQSIRDANLMIIPDVVGSKGESQSKRKHSVRGADLKIIPGMFVEDEGL